MNFLFHFILISFDIMLQVNIMDLHKKSLNFNDVSTLEIKNSMSGKVDLIPYKSQKDTNITIVIPSEKTKNLSLSKYKTMYLC